MKFIVSCVLSIEHVVRLVDAETLTSSSRGVQGRAPEKCAGEKKLPLWYAQETFMLLEFDATYCLWMPGNEGENEQSCSELRDASRIRRNEVI